MISMIWTLWIIHQFVNMIILLNFLIAIISQSYENVMSKSAIFKYKQRAQLNQECLMMLDYFCWLEEINIIAIAA